MQALLPLGMCMLWALLREKLCLSRTAKGNKNKNPSIFYNCFCGM